MPRFRSKIGDWIQDPRFYVSYMRPISECVSPAYIYRFILEERAFSKAISTRDLSYRQVFFNISTLHDRREAIGNLLFQAIRNSKCRKLRPLLPSPSLNSVYTRKSCYPTFKESFYHLARRYYIFNILTISK